MSAVEKAAQVLAEHATCEPFGGITHWRYSCGIEVPRPTESIAAAHHAHVAQALADAALLADDQAAETHTRTSTVLGPDYCSECSAKADEWVRWPCEGSAQHAAAPSEDAATGPAPGLHLGGDAASPPSEDVEALRARMVNARWRDALAAPGVASLSVSAQHALRSEVKAEVDWYVATILASDWLAAHDAQIRADAWDEAVRAVAWCLDSGEPSPAAALAYVHKSNPYRRGMAEGGDGRGH